MYDHSSSPPQLSIKPEERPMEKHHVKLNFGLVARMMGTGLLPQ